MPIFDQVHPKIVKVLESYDLKRGTPTFDYAKSNISYILSLYRH